MTKANVKFRAGKGAKLCFANFRAVAAHCAVIYVVHPHIYLTSKGLLKETFPPEGRKSRGVFWPKAPDLMWAPQTPSSLNVL